MSGVVLNFLHCVLPVVGIFKLLCKVVSSLKLIAPAVDWALVSILSNFYPSDVSCDSLVVIIELIAFVFPVINPAKFSDCKT